MAHKAVKLGVVLGKGIVLAGMTYLIARNIDLGKLATMVWAVHPGYFLLAMTCMFIVPVMLALRLKYVSGVAFGPLLVCVTKSYFFNNLFVAQIGGDIYKIYFLSGAVREKKRAVALVVGDRVIGLTGLVGLSLVNVLVGYKYFGDPRVYVGVAVYLLIVILLFAGIFLMPGNWLTASKRWPRLGVLLEKINGMRIYAKDTVSRKLVVGVLLTVLSYFLVAGVNTFAMRALHLRVDMIASVLYIPVISIAVVTLPISFNGLGVRESLFIVFFAMAGFTNEEGLAMAAVSLVGILLVSLVGGLLVFVTGDSLRAIKAQSEQRINS